MGFRTMEADAEPTIDQELKGSAEAAFHIAKVGVTMQSFLKGDK